MSRTKRGIPYKHYWGTTKTELARRIAEDEVRLSGRWSELYLERSKRDLLLYGTESRNYSCCTHYYFNRAHRAGRRDARDQLRPHLINDDFDFDDSHYTRKLKGVWWEIN